MAELLPARNLLLVEGKDDQHVVQHICGRHKAMPEFSILNKEGFSRLVSAIPSEINVANRAAVGILADANANLHARWQAIAHRLHGQGYDVPQHTMSGGIVIEGRPQVGVWLMPDNSSPGELEDFIGQMIPHGDHVWPRAESYIDGIPNAERKFKAQKIQRAKIHAWLATREEPRKIGTAIRAGDLDINVPIATEFIDWICRLFI